MPKPSCSSCSKLGYLRTPMGAVKVVNILFGAISLILVGASYVPVWTLGVFIGTVASCLFFSLLYMAFYLLASIAAVQGKANRVTSFLFHVLAGTALVVAGIELIGWSEYSDPSCKHNCPRLYTVGFAKTLTFMNGVLYLIVGFLGVKDDDLLDPDSADENFPLLSSTTVLTSVRRNSVGGRSCASPGPKAIYYDSFFHQPKSAYDNTNSFRSNFIYRLQRPYNPYGDHQADQSYSNSYVCGARFIPGGFNGESRGTSGSTTGSERKTVQNPMPGGNMTDSTTEIHFIKE